MGYFMTDKELIKRIREIAENTPDLGPRSKMADAFVCDQALSEIIHLIKKWEKQNGTNSQRDGKRVV